MLLFCAVCLNAHSCSAKSGGNRDQGNRKLNEDDIPRGLDLRPDDFAWMTEQIMGVRLPRARPLSRAII